MLRPDEEALPLIVGDAFTELETGEMLKLLEMVVRLSVRTQVVLLTSDATIARGGVVEQHEVPRLFAAKRQAILPHGLNDVAITDSGTDQLATRVRDGAFEAHVAHNRRDQGLLLEGARFEHARGAQGHDRIAVNNCAF